MGRRATIEGMTKRDYDDQPTEYGGVRDNRRSPLTGRPRRGSAPRTCAAKLSGVRGRFRRMTGARRTAASRATSKR